MALVMNARMVPVYFTTSTTVTSPQVQKMNLVFRSVSLTANNQAFDVTGPFAGTPYNPTDYSIAQGLQRNTGPNSFLAGGIDQAKRQHMVTRFNSGNVLQYQLENVNQQQLIRRTEIKCATGEVA